MKPEEMFISLFESSMKPVISPKTRKTFGVWWKSKRYATEKGKTMWNTAGQAMTAISNKIKHDFRRRFSHHIIDDYAMADEAYKIVVKRFKEDGTLVIKEIE